MATRKSGAFETAFVMTLRKLWPKISQENAIKWMEEYVGVPVGTRGYDWSAGTAHDLAREVASEFGEASDGKS